MITGVAICTTRPDYLAATLHENDLQHLPVLVFAGAAGTSGVVLRTERHPFAAPPSWDLWRRRNVAVSAARALGWDALWLFDDDIRGLTAAQVRDAIAAVEAGAAIAGFRISDEIDTSCVGHCSIALGHRESPPAASGACMLVRLELASHFPPVYNEDLLFAREASLRDDGSLDVAQIGDVRQVPQANRFCLERARSQEFGEVFAEGLEFGRRAIVRGLDEEWLEQDEMTSPLGDAAYRKRGFWAWALERRREEIDKLLGEAAHLASYDRLRMALDAASAAHDLIQPEHLVSFYEAWRADCDDELSFRPALINGEEDEADPVAADSMPETSLRAV